MAHHDNYKTMFDTICSIPLDSDLFAQAIHPTEPIFSLGLAKGTVQTHRLPAVADADDEASENGFGTIDKIWSTHRHKGSCRTLGFGADGAHLYSAGTDGIIKQADTATGRVIAKIAIPQDSHKNRPDDPCLLHALSPQTLLLGTDSGALHLYDLRALNANKFVSPEQTHHPHDDFISSITPLPPSEASTSGFSKQWVTTGGTTLAVTDLRRGIMAKSENQEEELMSSVIVRGLPSRGTSVGEKVLVGGGNGVLTLWERGVWDDQDARIIVDRAPGGGESLDTLALLPEGVGPGGKVVAVGLGNGDIRFVKIGPNKIIGEQRPVGSDDPVVGLDFDVGGRMISGAGTLVRVWHEKLEQDEDEDEDENEGEGMGKRALGSDDDDRDEDAEDDSSEEEQSRKRRKRRKKNQGGNQGAKNGILGFKGLD